MLALSSFSAGFMPVAPPAPVVSRTAGVHMETVADLKDLAEKANPVIGFWDPMNLVEYDQWSQGDEATIGFLRHAEIKHGRVAMAAFVGFCVQSNGIHFPWAMTTAGLTYAEVSAAGGPAAQWDALPTAAKLQILLVIGFLEFIGENDFALAASGEKHYMRGGKPGFYPSLKTDAIPHPVPFELFDPFGLSKNRTPEQKAKGLVAEINNGRLAQIGIMAFVSEAKVPGSVPALSGLITPYSGECMAPFSATDNLPFVADMLAYKLF